MTFGSLFAGIGGFDLGLEWAGMECLWQVEKDKFCQKILTKHWPDVPKYGDIKDVGKHNLETVDLICGGFPCQPFSQAGKRRGTEDDRFLWSPMLRVIREIAPPWVIGENVPGILAIDGGMVFEQILSDLEAEGYETQSFIIPACAVDAPHQRYRVYIIANTNGLMFKNVRSQIKNNKKKIKIKHSGYKFMRLGTAKQADYRKCDEKRENDGVSNRVDRLKSLGNAVVPQIPFMIGSAIMEIERNKSCK